MMTSDTPIYDQLHHESEWTPDQLREPFDLDNVLAESYQRIMVRTHLRGQIQRRAKIAASRRKRRSPLP